MNGTLILVAQVVAVWVALSALTLIGWNVMKHLADC